MIRTGLSLAVAVGLSARTPAADPPAVEFRQPDGLSWRGGPTNDPNWKPVRPAEPVKPPAPAPAPTVPVAVTTPEPFPLTLPARLPVLEPALQIEPIPVPVPKPVQEPPAKPAERPMPPVAPPRVETTPLPSPRPAPADTTKPTPPTTGGTPASAEGVVWGSYVPADGSGKRTPPVRHHTFGSPNLRLSRDYHFLDAFTAPLVGDDEKPILAEPSRGPRSFVQGEFLYWWVTRPAVPVLATTATGGGTGFLGATDTRVLLGPGAFGPSGRTGFRVRAGTWLDACQSCGLDASYFTLGRASQSRALPSSQFPTLARPFFAANLNQEFAQLVAFPGLSTGTLNTRLSSELWGADVNLRKALLCGCDRRLEAFAGYRHLNLSEDLAVTEFIAVVQNPPPSIAADNPPGTRIVVQDRFAVANRFHGGQLGLAGYQAFGRINLFGRASVALGNTRQILDITGTQVRTVPGGTPEAFRGGLLAAGPNLGRFTRNHFSVVPEATLNVGYLLTPNLNVYAGYNFLGWTNVIRPGDQIDRVVDTTFVPNFPVPGAVFTANRPLPTFRQTDLWVNGIQAGLELRW